MVDSDSRSGVKAVRPWSRPGERYAGYRWPPDDGLKRGRAVAEGAGTGEARTVAARVGRAQRASYRTTADESDAGTRLLSAESDLTWDELIARAEGAVTSPGFSERELNPYLSLAEHLRRARGAVLSRVKRHSWRAPLERALQSASERGLLAAATQWRLNEWCADAADDAREALRALWHDLGLLPADHLNLFLHAMPPRVARDPNERLMLATLLLGALDPARYPPFAGSDSPTDDPGLVYRGWLGELDELIAEAERRGLPLSTRLQAAAVLRHIEREVRTPRAPARARSVREAPRRPSLADLARDLLIEEAELAKIVRLLDDRGQCIFHGPPGTGKTYVARALARYLANSDAHVTVVQFHPSYAYEDFVEGFRPTVDGPNAGFVLQDGPLKRVADAARRHPTERFVLVIDELNRANVAKVFGELYYLLEYRDDSIQLQYSQEPFSLPRNLSILATMNAADRSIALVDLALRRRFYFVPFFPDVPPVHGLLRRWLTKHHAQLEWVADVVDRANWQLVDRHDRQAAIGPSHFMRADLTEEWVELIWEHSVLPTIAEQLFGDESAVGEFRLERLRNQKRRAAARAR